MVEGGAAALGEGRKGHNGSEERDVEDEGSRKVWLQGSSSGGVMNQQGKGEKEKPDRSETQK